LDKVVLKGFERDSVYVNISAARMYANAIVPGARWRQKRIGIGHIGHEGRQPNVAGRRVQIDLDHLVPVKIEAFGASVSHFNSDCYHPGVNPSTYDHAIVDAVREPIP
jgi:hypothetical protein